LIEYQHDQSEATLVEQFYVMYVDFMKKVK